ncbi:hypothetical protein Rsub_10529 [Raphidocelis subcapitata]|uniref:DSBA-like thioredoxin domain-containing protein n=1 Tax=Raphidocelis subcapitata TaxID=307507 RepID=A0A2V0PI86_9CHLO|nr:hypothetical protein Rsub_10529 [Raphidocelis subcapitata]|eukprot:GBF97653.1 hypothetical protein Rsub_10529 [Raphidocelis subcapitata]
MTGASALQGASAAGAAAAAPPRAVCEIDVVSDTVCPWCYVGMARLGKALAAFEGRLEARVRWLPFMLNPNAPEEGEDKLAMYNQKFGAARVAAIVPQMTRTFAEEGLPPYRVEGLTGATRNSHRLLLWAAEAHGLGAQGRLAEALFRGYFTEARFINDRAFLLEAVAAAGLPADDAARQVLDAPGAYEAQLLEELARHPGVTGVPHFVVRLPGERRAVARLGGAQPPEAFEEVFEAIVAAARAAAPAGAAAAAPDGGAACGRDGSGC